jgi:hypothetical protein
MVTMFDVIQIIPSLSDVQLCYDYARGSELGKSSKVRKEKSRKKNLSIDQFIGTGLGEYAGNLYYFTIDRYIRYREERNQQPYRGTSTNVKGYQIDFRASKLSPCLDLFRHRLAVRDELDNDCAYILILIDIHDCKTVEEILDHHAMPVIYIVGWLPGNKFPTEPETKKPFDGAYCVLGKDLYKPSSLDVCDFKD